MGDRTFTPVLLELGICKAIISSLDRIKTKSSELLTEMFWCLNYILDYDEKSVVSVIEQMPKLVSRLTWELEYEGDRLRQSPVNRPIIRILGDLLTVPSAGQYQIAEELIGDERFQTFLISVLLN